MQYKIRILPRWLVFVLDLFLVCFSLFLSRSLKLNFYWPHVMMGMRSMLLTVLVVNALLFYIFKSYAGIVRYTNLEDTSRLVMVNAVAAFFYMGVNIFFFHFLRLFEFLVILTCNFLKDLTT